MLAAAEERFVFHMDQASREPLSLSVVIPTLNERDNVVRLFQKLVATLQGIEWEAIFVDDGSTDGTAGVITDLARSDRRARLISRFGRRGLSSAVIEGMLSSTAPTVAVIDADLQHDETILPRLVEAIEAGECDLAVGSRYTLGGSVGDWSSARAAISRVATRLAECVTKARLADPMSGFFAVRRDRLFEAAPFLSGTGYKILLDLIASSPRPLRIAEMPYRFRSREAGESKLDAMVALEYLALLVDKLVGRWVPVRFVMFAAVGTLGLAVHLGVLAVALHLLAVPFTAAMIVATTSAMTFNFVLNNVLTYRDRRLRRWGFAFGLMKFYAVCSIGAAANVGVGELLYGRESWWLAGAAGAAIGSVWNFAVSSSLTWTRRK